MHNLGPVSQAFNYKLTEGLGGKADNVHVYIKVAC